jgi:hypothetical protein
MQRFRKPRKCEAHGGCDRPVIARGLCQSHWTRERNGEQVRDLPPPIRTPWTYEGNEDELAAMTAAGASNE